MKLSSSPVLSPGVRILVGVILMVSLTSTGEAQITAPGTDYVSFWSGDLRIFAQKSNTRVEIIDVDTNATLDLATDPRVNTSNCSTLSNPFVLSSPCDMFVCRGGLGGPNDEIRVRIVTSDPAASEDKPVTVWTGSGPVNGANSWGSYLPASFTSGQTFGREVGRDFVGFTQRDLILVAPRVPATLTQVSVTNCDTAGVEALSFDAGIPSCPALVNATPPIPVASTPCYLHDGPEVQAVYLNHFSTNRITVTSNVDLSALAGMNLLDFVGSDTTLDFGNTDWSSTPPSFAPGDDGIELGTKFFAFVRSGLGIFPTQDNTNVTVTDLTDGDDSCSFTLISGTPGAASYDVYTPYLDSFSAGNTTPRAAGPQVFLTTNTENPIDNDILKIEADKPVLVYQGPLGSDVREFADVAFSVPTGAQSRVVYTYAQNFGNSNDFQLFAFQRNTTVQITSLSFTQGFLSQTHHDFTIDFTNAVNTPPIVNESPAGSQFVALPTQGDIQHFGSGAWAGEMVRVESNNPITVISGDYDQPNFGAYIPFVPTSPLLPPQAEVVVDVNVICPGDTVNFDASGSFDQDDLGDPPDIVRYDWDFDDGDTLPDGGPLVSHTYNTPGTFDATVTVTDNEAPPNTQTDSAVATVTVLPFEDPQCEPPVCEPRTQGYWNRQCKGLEPGPPGPHPDFPDPVELQALMDSVEPDLQAVCDADESTCDNFDTRPPNDPCERACKQYAALLLNLASELLDPICETDSGFAGDVAGEVAALIAADECKAAADLADSVNTGGILVFSSGFESGDLSDWVTSSPQ